MNKLTPQAIRRTEKLAKALKANLKRRKEAAQKTLPAIKKS